MRLPADFSIIDAKTGLEWTQEETGRIFEWWSEPAQEKMVWYCAARYLGAEAAIEDVEEIWLDFYSVLFERARRSYRPIGICFCTYLLDVCLKNHCVQRGERIRRRAQREVTASGCAPEPGMLPLQVADSTVSSDPVMNAEHTALLEALNMALNDPQIKPLQRQAFLLRHLEQITYSEIARALDVPEGTIKIWVHRVTRRVSARLNEQGWSE